MTRRLLASYLALTLLVLLVLEIPLGLAYADRQIDDLSVALQRDAFTLAGFVEEELEAAEVHTGEEAASGEGMDLSQVASSYQERTGARVVIVAADGRALADSDPPAPGERYFDTRPEVAAALDGNVSTGTRPSETLGHRLLYVAVPVASGGVVHGAVRLTYPTSEVDERVRENWLRLGGIAVVTLVVAAGVGVALSRSVTRPLRDLQAVAAQLGEGQLVVRAAERSGPREVRALARSFNDMAGRLEQLVTAQEAFVAEASHQLRSPLTALRLRLENLEADPSAPTAGGDIEAAAREVNRLSRLVDGLLELARADRRAGEATASPVQVRQVLEERRETWAPLAAERGIRMELEGEGTVLASTDRLTQVIDNLIANAIDASPEGGTIRLEARREGRDHVGVHVLDEGPGLSEEERRRAFDRFWRASLAEGALGGTGLGLAIVRKLVEADGGTVELRARPEGGLDAVVTLAVPNR